MFRITCFAVAVASLASLHRSADAQTFNDVLVQPPVVTAPQRGSITGSLGGFSVSAESLSRGSFSLPLAIELPSERGAPLATPLPSYSPEGGLSEWGMGWQTSLEITRYRSVGDIDYATDDFVTPWGRITLATDGYYYPVGFSTMMRFELVASGWRARDGQGTLFEFDQTLTTSAGIYSWYLTRVTTITGDTTALSYITNASGRAFLDSVVYGQRGLTSYRLRFTYDLLTRPLESLRSGDAVVLDRRVASVIAEVNNGGYATRWSYSLTYEPSPLSSVFYLKTLTRAWPSGALDPAIRYDYDNSDAHLATAAFEHVPTLDTYIAAASANGIQPTDVSPLDVGRDALLDFEHHYAQAVIRQSPNGWTIEGLADEPNAEPACRAAPSLSNTPRLLAHLRAGDAEEGVLATIHSGSLNQTTFLFCDRPGILHDTHLTSGDWRLGPSTRFVDINRDLQPDVVRLGSGHVDILENTSDASSYGFAASVSQTLTPSFFPQASWVHDVNGDGQADLIGRAPNGLFVWSGRGQLQFTSQGTPWQIYDQLGVPITNLSSFGLWFTDANNDGLVDLILSQAQRVWLFVNDGDALHELEVPALSSLSWVMSNPVIADLAGTGDTQVVFSVLNTQTISYEARSLSLNRPSSGLLVHVDDGKGTTVDFDYARAVPESDLGYRTSLLASVTTESGGAAAVTRVYDYTGPLRHTVGEFILGFANVTSHEPQLIREVGFVMDDDLPAVTEQTLETDPRYPDLSRVTRRQLVPRNHLGVDLLRASSEETGWLRSSDGFELTELTDFVTYEREVCPTVVRIHRTSGVLQTTSVLDSPSSLLPDLHCLASTQTLSGLHSNAALDFTESIGITHNALGQTTAITRNGALGPWVLQDVHYDSANRIDSVSKPGQGSMTVAYDPATSLMSSVTTPDGVVTSVVGRHALSSAIREMLSDRGPTGVLASSFRFDDRERLERSWDDLSAGTQSSPLKRYKYRYASASQPAAITTESAVQVAGGTIARNVELFAGDGNSLASFAEIPGGWATTAATLRDPSRLQVSTLLRDPLTDTPLDLNYTKVFAFSHAISTETRNGLGHPDSRLEVLETGVSRSTTTSVSLTSQGLLTTTVENGNLTVTTLTSAGGLPIEQTNELGKPTTLVHDAAGRLRRVVLPDAATTQSTDYDDYGRVAVTRHDGAGEMVYRYAPVTGLLDSIEHNGGGRQFRTTSFSHDSLGRVIERRHSSAGGVEIFAFDFDGNGSDGQRGFLTEVTGPGFVKSTSRYPDGKVRSVALEVDQWLLVWSYDYYDDGSQERVVREIYDPANQLHESVELRGEVDGVGRPLALELNGSQITNTSYDGFGRVSSVALPSGSLSLSYDPVSRAPNGFQHTGGASASWNFNSRGLIANERNQVGSMVWDRAFTYDDRGFLASAIEQTAQSVETYQMDDLGLPSYLRDHGGKRPITRSPSQITAGSVTYKLDEIGRVIERDGRLFEYGYDSQITLVTNGSAPAVRFLYDEDGQRLAKYRGSNLEAIYANGGTFDGRNFIEPLRAGGRLVGVINGGSFEELALDQRGSVLADRSAGPLDVSPFGARALRPSFAAAMDYVEKGYDADLDTVRMGVRDYDPLIGQFLTPDPLFFADLDRCASSPTDCNLYAYARNNPISLVDPSGLEPDEIDNGTAYRHHEVASGDTLGEIAASNGVELEELHRHNGNIVDKDYIYPGNIVRIPVGKAFVLPETEVKGEVPKRFQYRTTSGLAIVEGGGGTLINLEIREVGDAWHAEFQYVGGSIGAGFPVEIPLASSWSAPFEVDTGFTVDDFAGYTKREGGGVIYGAETYHGTRNIRGREVIFSFGGAGYSIGAGASSTHGHLRLVRWARVAGRSADEVW